MQSEGGRGGGPGGEEGGTPDRAGGPLPALTFLDSSDDSF